MNKRLGLLAAAVACAIAPAVAQTETPAAQAATPQHIAVVNGKKVTVEEFERAFGAAARQKFYHRQAPEGQVQQVRREVADGLVDRALLLAEAEKRGVPVDSDAIQQVLDGYEQRYGSSPNWKVTRERALPEIRRELANQQLLSKLEAGIRKVDDPEAAAVRAFYDANPALFTEPERVHLSVILLKVDPSSPKAVRDQAREEGRAIRERLAGGADFAEAARIHSGDGSAAKGGDMGYVHRGMLPEALHQAIDSLKAGDISQSLDVLDGVAIFKLHDRAAAKQRDFESVAERARDLLKRQLADKAWNDFVAGLRRNAVIERVGALYPAEPAGEREAGKEATWSVTDKPRAP